MFLDLQNAWPPPEPWRPERKPRITRRQQRAIGWIVMFNLLMLLLGPLAGATLFDVVLYALRH